MMLEPHEKMLLNPNPVIVYEIRLRDINSSVGSNKYRLSDTKYSVIFFAS